MSRKKRKFEANIPDADKFIGGLKYKGLKKECVIRGMGFEEVLSSTILDLSHWLRHNFMATMQPELLDAFDDYQENLIRESVNNKGGDPEEIIHPSLRLGFIAERDEDGNVIKRKRVRTVIRRKKQRRERTAQGVFAGTKKALTYQLQKEGHDKKTVIEKVLEQFPEASEKSIGIWFNKAKKL